LDGEVGLDQAHNAYLETEIDRYLADPAHDVEIVGLLAHQIAIAQQKYPFMTRAQQHDLATLGVRFDIRQRMGLLSLDDFARRELSDHLQPPLLHDHHASPDSSVHGSDSDQ
jgi:hypothetical protein